MSALVLPPQTRTEKAANVFTRTSPNCLKTVASATAMQGRLCPWRVGLLEFQISIWHPLHLPNHKVPKPWWPKQCLVVLSPACRWVTMETRQDVAWIGLDEGQGIVCKGVLRGCMWSKAVAMMQNGRNLLMKLTKLDQKTSPKTSWSSPRTRSTSCNTNSKQCFCASFSKCSLTSALRRCPARMHTTLSCGRETPLFGSLWIAKMFLLLHLVKLRCLLNCVKDLLPKWSHR